MKRALLVGIDDYPRNPLSGCVADARAINELLQNNDDGSPNMQCRLLTSESHSITRGTLRIALQRLFSQSAQIALFYFSGHGINVTHQGGYLVTTDVTDGELGIPMQEVLDLANVTAKASGIAEVVIILDCCDSGVLGQVTSLGEDVVLREGVSILTSSGPLEPSIEHGGRGVFTRLVCDALSGGAADVRGEVNAASIYSYCDEILGAWDQRPRFKANVSQLTELRMCKPQVELDVLRRIIAYFPSPSYEYPLDPSYEPDKSKLPTGSEKNEEHETIFSHLQNYRNARLLVPIGTEHMFYAAVNSLSCKLTPLGQFYWSRVNAKQI